MSIKKHDIDQENSPLSEPAGVPHSIMDDGGGAFPFKGFVGPTESTSKPYSSGMTLRQYAAIKLRQPKSGIDWLDEMILQAKQDDYAGMVLQGAVAHGVNTSDNLKISSECFIMANTMTKQGEK